MLPKLSYPIFDVVIPSMNKKVKMRPFLVREEKILLLAQMSEEPTQVVEAIKQVIEACIDDASIVPKLTMFDIEYLFVKLRSRSVNNTVDILYTDPDDGEQYKVTIDLDNVEVRTDPDHSKKIEISPTVGVIMKYPPTDLASKLENVETEVDLFFQLITLCIDQIYDADNVYNASETTLEEIQEFVSSLDVNAFKKMQRFFETLPKIHYETKYTTKDGVEKSVVLQTLNDFFMLG